MNRYETASILKDSNEKRKLSTVITPTPEANTADVFIQTTGIERLDLLAFKFYDDQSLWYIIAAANGLGKGSLYVPANSRLRIPSATTIQQQTDQINKTR
jgi:hypothetical protein